MSRDSWERLVAAVLKREQIWQLCHQHSRSPSISTIASDISSDFSEQIINFSSYSLEPISVSPHPPLPLTNPSVPQVSNNASEPITRKLFSAWYRRFRKHKDEYLVHIPGIHLRRVREFSLHELQVATENFSNKNVLRHGSKLAYKGWLAEGSPVAVRRLKDKGSLQSAEVQFQREVEINSIVAHPNVLNMLGFCIARKQWLLVYPLMVHGSVASCLRDRHESQPLLNWPLRKGIALGAAKGLAYLHYECDKKIIHRGVTAGNILLDESFEALVADFELAIIMDHDDTDFEDAVRGTSGDIAPEYLSTGKCSEKTDVYGYGIFLLELITGQRAFDLARLANDEDMRMLDWVKRNYKEGMCEKMVDADCGGNYMEEVVEQLVQIALFCTQSTPEGCPKMSEVVGMLEVGDGLAERWEEWCKAEDFHRRVEINETYSSNIIFHNPGKKDLVIHLGQVRRFSLHELQVATENFSYKNVLGYGNMIYKGWLADGSPVAVKKHIDKRDLSAEMQFQKVVEINSIAAHPNVLHMLGICITPKEQLILYPLIVNGSVASWLRGRHESQPPLNWPVRKGIALGAARGLAYLHYGCDKKIIHRNITAANILLDENFEAVVADFELAIIMDHDVTDFVDAIRGTMGYIAPEYLSTFMCSEKTDVFGYGMFLLDLITGQRAYYIACLANNKGMMILDWVKGNFKQRKWEMMVDPDCGGNFVDEEVEQLMQIALLCTQSSRDKRPKMSEVVGMLEVGDGLAERWEEWCKEEDFHH